MKETKYEQVQKEQRKQDEEFLKWLSPSHWLVEGQLSYVREQRAKGSLQWALVLEEFQRWQLADVDNSPESRVLWIRGPLGIGKSTMAGYFIDLLKCQYPNAIVAYFFCRTNEAGLMKARDIIRTLAYQCIEGDHDACSMLEELKKKGFVVSENVGVCYLFEKLLLEPLHRSRKDIYVILDGLDEADVSTMDGTDRAGRTEMEILLSNLTRLPSSRLLFISRPHIASIIPNVIVKGIGKDQNQQDIDSYVKMFVAGSKNL
jgi:hypothetical protein